MSRAPPTIHAPPLRKKPVGASLTSYVTLDALLIDEDDLVVERWRIDVSGFAAAFALLGCAFN